jgi:hypothetical protein
MLDVRRQQRKLPLRHIEGKEEAAARDEVATIVVVPHDSMMGFAALNPSYTLLSVGALRFCPPYE